MKTDRELIFRYLKMDPEADPETAERVGTVCEAMERALSPGYVFRLFSLSRDAGPGHTEAFRLGTEDAFLSGKSASCLLTDCHSVAVLVATLGFGFDKMLLAAQKRDMTEALILDACGSAYIETVADDAEEEIKILSGGYLTDRFSPGYGDMPLSLQPVLIRLSDAEKRLGVHALDSFLLDPVKTVTAVIGISDTPRPSIIRGCANCSMNKTCLYKKGDGSCEARK